MTDDQREALTRLDYAHDEMRFAIRDVQDIARGGDIGWNVGRELSAHASVLHEKWQRIDKALELLRPLREDGK